MVAVPSRPSLPMTPSQFLSRQRRRYPEVTNARLLRKGEIRDAFNKAVPPDKHCNALHSSDNGHEALEYIQILLPEALPHIRQQIVARKQVAAAQDPIIFKLSTFRRRATAELIEHHGQLAVKKTFRPHQHRYCQRKARALRELSLQIREIPPLLMTDSESVVLPYYDDILHLIIHQGKLLPLAVAKPSDCCTPRGL